MAALGRSALSAILVTSAFLCLTARAEYRAYKMTITNQTTGAQRTVTSNLDPDQYGSLYPMLKEETIELQNSWKCYGDTSHKPICPERERPVLESLPKSDLQAP